MKVLRFLLMVALTALLAVGCAKKPAPTAALPMEDAPVVTEMPSEDVRGIRDGELDQQAVEDMTPPTVVEVAGLERIYFDFDQYTLSAEARATLAANADYLKANPGSKVRIEGHCDERGSDEYNLALGERRALAAKNYLNSLGVAASRLSFISFGEEVPLDPRRSSEAWAANRRAEFKEIQ
ncbi:MAG: peptidoglycan-associated lipoprotein [Desulfuromonas sp.]|uniref:peptidoglycan-associated lipoprotein Pal n=1 Tax=Desulfuromonas sp. TaxID=892 RepID=UPI000CB81DB6|nr:peptidoglycan-associated lipoprotein Pal [Desulfuromonas sp.]PLX84041.1 MAG: peptidoglycan-associated lipoprotein [Desulfuromonas sp.]